MNHDHKENGKYTPKKLDGKKCYGYMDYKDGSSEGDFTNQWSHCSVRDFTNYVDRQRNFCLQSVGGGNGGDGGDGGNECKNLVSNKTCKKKCGKSKKCRRKDYCKVNCKETCGKCGLYG